MEFFDAIYCINLYDRIDRYNSSKKLFKKHNIPVKYYRTHKHPEGGLHGCFESHINVINLAYNSGAKNVLIFEDDIQDCNQNVNIIKINLKKAINFMKNKTWDIFYLGTFPYVMKKWTSHIYDYPNIYEMTGLCTHAYVINHHIMKKLKDLTYSGTPYDYLLRDNFRCFSIYPSIFYQGNFSSDISNYIDIHKKVSFNTVLLWVKINEAYAYYIGVPIPILLILFLILFILMVIYLKFNKKYWFKDY